MQLYELKEIQSEDDLPKARGAYRCLFHNGSIMILPFYPKKPTQHIWMSNVHSYFSPVSVEKDTVYVKTEGDFELGHIDSQVGYLKQSEVLIVKQ